jgi:Glycoside hydrolase family 44/Immunoglobulin I-set domain
VTAAQAAPSSRWDAVVDNKPGGVYDNPPDLTDGTVYMDELLNVLITKYGKASGSTGVKGYDLDNEPALWPSTHPLLHPAATTCAEIITKSVSLSQTVKRMDSTAEVLGPVLYGSEAYFTLQDAPDWAPPLSTGYRWFIDYYLDQMNKASTSAGNRLLDVLDLHRYSDENVSGTGPDQSITDQTDFTDTATDKDRVQAPRVLWDPSYVENSWVQQYYSQFLPYIPNLQTSIATYNPGTKLSFTEYSYGGESDISGGLAQADVLGIYGKFGVYLGCVWILHDSPAPLYTAAAFNLYLSYDGQGGKFGATSLAETDSDTVNSSAYASGDPDGTIHVVVLNKSYTESANFSFQIAGTQAFTSANVYAFDNTSSTLTARTTATLTSNQVTYSLAPLTAAHFVFHPGALVSPNLPQFTTQPVAQTVASGTTVVFGVAATGGSATTYQWSLNNIPLADGGPFSGAASPTLVVSGATSAKAGSYTCAATNSSGTALSSAATLTVIGTANPGRLINLSCRAEVGTGADIMTAGFVVGGAGTAGPQSVLVRGSGPALGIFGLTGLLPDPKLTLNNTSDTPNEVVAADAGWEGSSMIATEAAALGAFSWGTSATPDSALFQSLPRGNYTAQIAGASGDTGLALVEVYDATPAGTYTATTPHLVNLSALIQVGSGANVVFAGFVVGGATSKTVLIRASGPALAAAPFSFSGTLQDPRLTLTNTSVTPNQVITVNTGWGGDAQVNSVARSVGAFQWNLSSADSAILITLPPGNYTAGVKGASGDTGLSLIELYEVP